VLAHPLLRGLFGRDWSAKLSTASQHLLSLGRTVLDPFARLPGVACAAITGSSAEGLSDTRSDLDMTVYYDAMPPEDAIRAARENLGGGPLIWSLGAHADGEFAEAFRLNGVECQIGHVTVARWEVDMAKTLAGEEPGSPLHKAMSGTLVSIPVFGAPRLEAWQARLRDYPHALRLAMVRHHLTFFAMWGVWERLRTRDANLWLRQSLVETSFNLLGVAAGLSGKYFTPFQFKRSGAFIASLGVAPARFAERLEALWHVPPERAVLDLRDLVADTVALVERELPEVDTAAARKGLARRDEAWPMPA
jgi:hypothetical protein